MSVPGIGPIISSAMVAAIGTVPYLVREFQPKFEQLDLPQLPNYSIYLKLMINGTPSMPFSATTLESLY
jgi:hypothetical protein